VQIAGRAGACGEPRSGHDVSVTVILLFMWYDVDYIVRGACPDQLIVFLYVQVLPVDAKGWFYGYGHIISLGSQAGEVIVGNLLLYGEHTMHN
jgi:hypothetical protein